MFNVFPMLFDYLIDLDKLRSLCELALCHLLDVDVELCVCNFKFGLQVPIPCPYDLTIGIYKITLLTSQLAQ